MTKLDKITDRISETNKKLDMGKRNSWIDIEQTDELMGKLETLQKLKKDQEKIKSNLASKWSFIQESEADAQKKNVMAKFEGAMGTTFVKRQSKIHNKNDESLESISKAF